MSLFGWAWGEVPTWLAFGAATVAATATWRTLIRQQQGDKARAELAKRDQANKITAWMVDDYEHEISIRGDTFDRPDWAVHISNGSDEPV